jgi:CubicO group peptidase (beta-lactamase class C family)
MPDAPSTAAHLLPGTARALLYQVARVQAECRAPSLMAGVVRDGVPVWTGGRGRVGGTAPTSETQYRIGSITKTFTAVLIARLRDEGRLDFADPLERHVTGTPIGDRTIAQLLSHTSGAQSERDGAWWERTPGDDWTALSSTFGPHTVKHPAGRRYHYSNLGYAVLGEVVARHRGRSWWDALRGEILEPLELRRTTSLPDAPHAEGFAVHPWADLVLPEPAHDTGAMAPAGQLWSTVGDLSRWAAFIGGDTGGVVSPDTLAELREPVALERTSAWTNGYGLGLRVLRQGGRTMVGHQGSMPGFLADLLIDVDEQVGAVTLANTTSGVAGVAAELVETVLDAEPRLPAEWAPAERVDECVLEIVGQWYWGPAGFVLRARGGELLELTRMSGGDPFRFHPSGDGTWTGLDGYFAGETLRVVRQSAVADPGGSGGPADTARLADTAGPHGAGNGRVSHLDLATFTFTREPYDPRAAIPGGVAATGWSGLDGPDDAT